MVAKSSCQPCSDLEKKYSKLKEKYSDLQKDFSLLQKENKSLDEHCDKVRKESKEIKIFSDSLVKRNLILEDCYEDLKNKNEEYENDKITSNILIKKLEEKYLKLKEEFREFVFVTDKKKSATNNKNYIFRTFSEKKIKKLEKEIIDLKNLKTINNNSLVYYEKLLEDLSKKYDEMIKKSEEKEKLQKSWQNKYNILNKDFSDLKNKTNTVLRNFIKKKILCNVLKTENKNLLNKLKECKENYNSDKQFFTLSYNNSQNLLNSSLLEIKCLKSENKFLNDSLNKISPK